MNKIISKSDYDGYGAKELYKMIYERFRIQELQFILEKIGYSQKEFLNRLGKKSYTGISRLVELNKNETSSEKSCINSKWVDLLRNEIGDEKLLILRDLFKESKEYKKMVDFDAIIDDKLGQGRIK